MLKTNNSEHGGFLIIEVVVLAVVLLAGGYAYYQYNTNKNKVAPATTPKPHIASPSPSANPTASWKTYNDTFDGYSIKYPSGWFLSGSASTGGYAMVGNFNMTDSVGTGNLGSDQFKVEIHVFESSDNLIPREFAAEQDANNLSNLGEKTTNQDAKNFTINRNPAYYRQITTSTSSNGSWQLWVVHSNKMYLISAPVATAAFSNDFTNIYSSIVFN